MKQLKYLKLFEAFESEKLSKTLGYIDTKSRNEVISKLKGVCNSLDFPFSKLDDSYFKYLPYKKALDLQWVGEKNPCKATSKSEFGGHGIEGEVCQGGRLKRMWGSRQRIVECPNCGGSGIQPENSEIKLLKFWFTKEGQLVTITGVDSSFKPELKSKSIGRFSRNISDYNILGPAETRSLKHGEIVLAKIKRSGDKIICFVYKTGSQIYLIQDEHDGDTPGRDYRSIARYSWNITHGDYYSIEKLEPKTQPSDDEDEEEIDPFSFNRIVAFERRGYPYIDKWRDQRLAEIEVSKAHFALVFDLNKLKTSEYKTKGQIKDERTELKSGSVLQLTDETVKRANIERYMSEIAKRSDIIKDVSNLQKVIKRIIGGENIIFNMLYGSRYSDNLNTLASNYANALKEGEESSFYKDKLSRFISDRYRAVSITNSQVSNNLKSVKKMCEKEGLTDYLKIVETLEMLGKKLYQKILEMPFECIEDIEIIKAKLDSIKSIFRSDRYLLGRLDYFIDSLFGSNVESSFKYLTNHYYVRDYKSEIITGLQQAIKVLDRY